MPVLASLLVSLFGGLVGFLAQWVSKKVALVAAAIATFATLTAALFVALGTAISALQLGLPNVPGITTAIWLALPDNFPLIVSTLLAFDASVALYRWNVQSLKLAGYVT